MSYFKLFNKLNGISIRKDLPIIYRNIYYGNMSKPSSSTFKFDQRGILSYNGLSNVGPGNSDSGRQFYLVSSSVKSFHCHTNRCGSFPLQQRKYYTTNMSQNNSIGSSAKAKDVSYPIPFGHIAGKVWNEGGNVAVLCLHGWQDNAGTFDNLAPLLPKHLSLIAIDFQGHGQSSHKPNGVSEVFMEYALTIDRIVKIYGWKQVYIIGHSMGAAVGMIYASVRPNLVHSLVMIDLVKPMHSFPAKQPRKTAEAFDAIISSEEKMKNKQRPSYPFDELVRRAMKSHAGNLSEAGVRTLLQRGSQRLPDGSYTFTYDLKIRVPSLLSASEEQLLAFAANLRCRLLVLKAEDGPYYEAKETYDTFTDTYRGACSEFQYVTVPGTHHTHLETPHNVAPLISAFLSVDNIKAAGNEDSSSQ